MLEEKMFPLNSPNMESRRKLSRRTVFAVAILLCVSAVAFLFWPRCNYSCRAHALYKNRIFFELRDIVSGLKKEAKSNSISVDPSHFSDSFLHENGVGYWGVTESGEVFVSDVQGGGLLVAEPLVNTGDVVWRCRFYPQPIEIPLCPSGRKLVAH